MIFFSSFLILVQGYFKEYLHIHGKILIWSFSDPSQNHSLRSENRLLYILQVLAKDKQRGMICCLVRALLIKWKSSSQLQIFNRENAFIKTCDVTMQILDCVLSLLITIVWIIKHWFFSPFNCMIFNNSLIP